MSLFKSNLVTTTSSSVLSFFIVQEQDGDLELNPDYQRDYVWDKKNAQSLLFSVFSNLPLGSISVVLDPKADKYCEIVDGKQRITTLLKFFNNEFPVYVSIDTETVVMPEKIQEDNVKAVYFKDLNLVDQRRFKSIKTPQIQLMSTEGDTVSRIDKLAYFHRVNFAGVPISNEHKTHVEKLILQELTGN
jgi:uncharacterized protein with ParB-like and HNH nuclease domain